jgi:TrmH family RNA methyltransferase
LINPCKLDDECYARAMHADKLLDDATIFKDFKNATHKIDYLLATSSIDSKNDKRHLRNAIYLDDLSKKLFEIEGKVGIVFGREDYGLFNEEIAECDVLVKIPTSPSYTSLNLSHSVAIVLYSLFTNKELDTPERKELSKIEKEKLYSNFSEILKSIDYPKHKKDNTELMFKRIMGRAIPSKWEYHTLMGVFSKIIEKKNQDINNKD